MVGSVSKHPDSLIILVLPLLSILLCSPCLYAQKLRSAPPLFIDQNQSVPQPVAREFFPTQAEGSDQTKAVFSVNRSYQMEFTIQNTGPSYKNCTLLWCYLPLNND